MSLDSSEPSPCPSYTQNHRDWFFPSAPFLHTSTPYRNPNPNPNPKRRRPLFPSTAGAGAGSRRIPNPKPYLRDSSRFTPSSSFSSSSNSSPPSTFGAVPYSISRREAKYSGARRKVSFDTVRSGKDEKKTGLGLEKAEAVRVEKKGIRGLVDFPARVKIRWPMAIIVAVSVSFFWLLMVA